MHLKEMTISTTVGHLVCVLMMFIESDSEDSNAGCLTIREPYDKGVLLSGLLTDSHIDFAIDILRRQHPHIDGLETPLLSQSSRGFSVPSKVKHVVQIHHLGAHWATSYRPANMEEVYVYDSLRSHNSRREPIIVPSFKTQLRQLYGSLGKTLTVYYPTTTQQRNFTDCGVFAVAFAVDLCAGFDPARREYEHSNMRHHIADCFQLGSLRQFPSTGERTPTVFTLLL